VFTQIRQAPREEDLRRRGRISLRLEPQFRRIARRAQVDNMPVSTGHSQPIRAVDRSFLEIQSRQEIRSCGGVRIQRCDEGLPGFRRNPLQTISGGIATLMTAKAAGGFAALIAAQPARFTAADRLQGVPTKVSQTLVTKLRQDDSKRADFLAAFGFVERTLDCTDGLRMICEGGVIMHLRPSGNAPELRPYAEAATASAAHVLLQYGLMG
jgi:hypothetical protein